MRQDAAQTVCAGRGACCPLHALSMPPYLLAIDYCEQHGQQEWVAAEIAQPLALQRALVGGQLRDGQPIPSLVIHGTMVVTNAVT